MTVAELIEVLKELPQDLEVVTTGLDEGLRVVNTASRIKAVRVPANLDYYGDYVQAESYVGETHGTSAPFETVHIR